MDTDARRAPLTWPPEIRNPEWAAIALIRLLFGHGIEEAEEGWDEGERMELARGEIAGRRWYELHRPGQPNGYILVDDTKGRYSRLPPTPEELGDSPLIKVECGAGPNRALRDYFQVLLAKLPEANVIRRDGAALSQRLEAGLTDPAFAVLADGFRRDYCGAALMCGLMGDGSTQAAAREARANSSLRDVVPRQVALDWARDLRARYAGFQISAPVAAPLYLMTALLSGVEDPPLRFLFQMQATPSGDLLACVLKPFVDDPGLHAAILSACDTLDEEGQESADTARRAEDAGMFMGATFVSVPCFLAARLGCQMLSAHGKMEQAARGRATSRAIGYEEECVISRTALEVDFKNALDGATLRGHRVRIDRERAEKGPKAAEALWKDYQQRKRLYPSFWRPFFMGETDTLPS